MTVLLASAASGRRHGVVLRIDGGCLSC